MGCPSATHAHSIIAMGQPEPTLLITIIKKDSLKPCFEGKEVVWVPPPPHHTRLENDSTGQELNNC